MSDKLHWMEKAGFGLMAAAVFSWIVPLWVGISPLFVTLVFAGIFLGGAMLLIGQQIRHARNR